MNNFWNSNIGKTIRWVFFLPTAIITGLLVAVITLFINQLRSDTQGDLAYMAAAIFGQVALLFTAYHIVPKFKQPVIIILVIIRTLFSLTWFFDPNSSLLSSVNYLILQEISVLGIGIYYSIYSKKNDLNY
ncbi:hypothetical protein [Penaeicola halotolerans]|uniref:hypothetical protein n=1 Tax=Penaeicola halotolerans TaxID=2793196 RepID=UPI001CF914BA|nr:hypothetical protein [Penaeicola halotolerans]